MKNRIILSLIILAVAAVAAIGIVYGDTTSQMNLAIIQSPAPRRPILNFPAPNATTSYTNATFQMTATIPTGGSAGNYIQYKQEIYQNEACTQIVQSNSQTSTQTGWSGQNASSGAAHTAGNATGTTGIYALQTNLTASTTYYWGAQAYDPDGSGAWGTSTLTHVDNAWATNANSLPSAIRNHSAVAYNGYIYTTGGYSPATTSVFYAPIMTSGMVGTWISSANKLPAAIFGQSAVAYGGYIYTTGGYSGNVTSSVFYANIIGSSTGAWSTSPNKLPSAIYDHSAVAYDGYIYTMGGVSSTATSSVFYAPINPDGSPGSWSTSPNQLPGALYYLSAVAYNGYIYTTGGTPNGSAGTSSVFYAPINSDHTPGTWSTSPNQLPSTLYGHSAVVYNGYIYTTGGNSGSGVTSSVFYAPIQASGTVGVWNVLTNQLPSSTYLHSSAASNGYIYVVGGFNSVTNTSTISVLYSQINVQGKTSDEGWVNNVALASSTSLNQAVSYGGYLYSIGGTADGTNGTTTVNYVAVNSNGTLNNWGTTSALPANTVQHGAFAYGGKMYVVGGSSTVSVAGNQVAQSTIGGSGVLGSWSTSTSAQLPSSTNNSFVGVNLSTGYVYVVGGDNTSAATSAVLYGLISSTGTIPNWSSTNPLPNVITKAGGVVLNNVIYSIGGSTDVAASSPTTTVNYAPINTDGSVASWTFSTFLPAPLVQPSVQTYNNFIYITGGSSTAAYGGVTSTILYAQQIRDATGAFLNGTGTLSSWLAATVMSGRLYQHGSAIANGYLYTVGGKTTGGAATSTIQNIGLYTSCVRFTTPPIVNNLPSVTDVVLNHGSTTLILTPNATTSFDINYKVTDQDGCTNIVNMTSTAFRLGVAPTCATANPTTNNLNCYVYSTHTTSSCISTTQYNVTDTVAIYYFAQSTGDASATYPNDQWEAYAVAVDLAGATSSILNATSSARHVGVMTSIELSTTTISYGSLYTNTNTSSTNQRVDVVNAGNSSTSLQISGTAFTSSSNSIATGTQHYATTSFTYGGSEQQVSSTAVAVSGFLLTHPTSTLNVSSTIFWGMAMPSSTPAGSYQSTVTYTAVFSP